jgi:type IV pilus assembly protein PilO
MSMAFFEPLLDLPRWQRVVLGVVGLTAFTAAAYFLGLAGLESRVITLQMQRDSQRQELARLRAIAADLTRFQREAVEVERQLELAKEKLPSEREMPVFYRTLSDAAVQAGLAVTLFQPQSSRVRDFYSEIPISLVAEGGYHDVGDFVGRVAALSRTTTIGELKLTGVGASTRPGSGPAAPRGPGSDARSSEANAARRPRHSLRAEITLFTYVYRPVGAPPAPKPAAQAKPEAPRS